MKGYPVDYLVRWFWTTLMLACFVLALAYPVPHRTGGAFMLAVFAAGTVVVPWIFQPIMALLMGLVLVGATPAGYLFGATSPPGLSGEQVCTLMGVAAAWYCPLKAYPFWKNLWRANEDTQDLGPKSFWLAPIGILGGIALAYVAGANPQACLAGTVMVQVWQLWQACRLDHLAYKMLPPSDSAYEAPMGA